MSRSTPQGSTCRWGTRLMCGTHLRYGARARHTCALKTLRAPWGCGTQGGAAHDLQRAACVCPRGAPHWNAHALARSQGALRVHPQGTVRAQNIFHFRACRTSSLRPHTGSFLRAWNFLCAQGGVVCASGSRAFRTLLLCALHFVCGISCKDPEIVFIINL